jgi:membrane protein insertase Oxa1/YidC/SpoIIIJ
VQIPKLCGFYEFQREYLAKLIELKVVNICEEKHEELEERTKKTVTGKDGEDRKDMELKMQNLMWKMNFLLAAFLILLVAVVVAIVLSRT